MKHKCRTCPLLGLAGDLVGPFPCEMDGHGHWEPREGTPLTLPPHNLQYVGPWNAFLAIPWKSLISTNRSPERQYQSKFISVYKQFFNGILSPLYYSIGLSKLSVVVHTQGRRSHEAVSEPQEEENIRGLVRNSYIFFFKYKQCKML